MVIGASGGRVSSFWRRVGLAAVLGTLGSASLGCASSGIASETMSSRSPTASAIAQSARDGLPKGASQDEPTDPREPKGVAVPIEGSELVRGSATTVVDAPLAKVREGVLGFADYADFMPHYTKSKMLGRNTTGGRDVYMEVSALHGAVKMWARLEVPKPAVSDGVETVEMRFVEGNVKELRGTWRMKALEGDKTELTLEIFLHPSLPLPNGLLNEQNVEGAVKGVKAMRDRVEKAAK
jgi:ribosome-associated toxin RatA of RatAB toxin-antitoxin module